MKLGKPSESTVKDTIALAGGAIAGTMAGRAAFGLIHNPTVTTDPTQLKKDQNMALIKRVVMIAGAGALAAAISGKDGMSTAVRGLAVGVAVGQAGEVVTSLAAKSGIATEAAASTTAQKMLARAVGLGCPCTEVSGMLGNAYPTIARFDMRTQFDNYMPVEEPVNALEQWASKTIAA